MTLSIFFSNFCFVIINNFSTKSNYHKVNLIEELAERCKSENKNFKAVKDGEVITK